MASFASAAREDDEEEEEDYDEEEEEKYDMFVIFNFHGNISKTPIIPKIVKHDVAQISSELNDYGYFTKGTIFDIIIENVNGSKRAIDIVKHKIRDMETEEFAEMVETETFSEELEKAKTYFLNGKTSVSFQECEKIMKNLESKFLVDTPEIQQQILLKIKKICHAISQGQNPPPKTMSTRSSKTVNKSKTVKKSTLYAASIVKKQFEDLKKFFIKINSNFFAGILLRHRTYKNCFPAWDFEGRHETDAENNRGILIGAYDGSALDVCFQHIIELTEFKQLIQLDPTKKIDPNLLKNKDHCILRNDTLIYGILYFLGQNCFYIDEDIDEDEDESPRKEDYFRLLEELSRNYDELPSEIGGTPYQTTMININAFIIKLKILAIRYWQNINKIKWTNWDEYSTYLDGGAMKAHFYGFTCSKLHNITIDTQCGIVRSLSIPRGGSKTRRKKPRNKHSRKSCKRSNSLILKMKRKPRK